MIKENISYRILKFLPPYLGDYLSIKGVTSDNGVPIEFINSNGEKWVYNFSNILDDSIKIFDIGENQYFLIIISKTAYTVDKENKNSIKEIASGVREILKTKNQIILIQYYSILIIENTNSIIHLQNYSLSDIRKNKIENGFLKGVLDYDFIKKTYQIDLKNRNFELIID